MIQATAYGKIGKIEVKSAQSGMIFVKGSLASNRFEKGENVTDWISFTVFGKIAEAIGNKCKVGDTIILAGSLQEEKWEKDGVKQSRHVLIANAFDYAAKKIQSKENKFEPAQGFQQPTSQSNTESRQKVEDIPF